MKNLSSLKMYFNSYTEANNQAIKHDLKVYPYKRKWVACTEEVFNNLQKEKSGLSSELRMGDSKILSSSKYL